MLPAGPRPALAYVRGAQEDEGKRGGAAAGAGVGERAAGGVGAAGGSGAPGRGARPL